MFELLFLMSYTFHNIEEGLWLPKWSKYAERFHPPVAGNEFHFALIVVTLIGYILTFLFLVLGTTNEIVKYLYLGFVLMMSFNAIFPHLIATVALKRYAPGLLTGVFLNLPLGLYLIFVRYGTQIELCKLFTGFVAITLVTLLSLRPLFKLGKRLIDAY